jgi:hypothetical protein
MKNYDISYFDAMDLWHDILAFAKTQYKLGAEGNSGEFHDERAEKELIDEEKVARETLQETFRKMTGWFPVCDEDFSFSSIKDDQWVLVKL